MSFDFQSYGLSDIGTVRKKNEDYWAQMPKENFYVLADGMGGHRAGEIASKETVEYLCKKIKKLFYHLSNAEDVDLLVVLDELCSHIETANNWIHFLGNRYGGYKGMGTTICMIFFHSNNILYSHVGDSRIYRVRHNKISPLTTDHSLQNFLDPDDAMFKTSHDVSCRLKRLTRAIGTQVNVSPDVGIDEVHSDDIYLLCSDGLTDVLSEKLILQVLKNTTDLEEAGCLLNSLAQVKGTRDNVTLILVRANELSRQQQHNTVM